MSIQSQLNADALSALPMIKRVINDAEAFESNQMRHVTIQRCMDAPTAVAYMRDSELLRFQRGLIAHFRYQGWLEGDA